MKRSVLLSATCIAVSVLTLSCSPYSRPVVLEYPGSQEEAFFGQSVAIHGDYAIVGAFFESNGDSFASGAAYIYKRQGGAWKPMAILHPDKPARGIYFGRSVDIYGDYAVVGAPWRFLGPFSHPKDVPGEVYVFKRNADESWIKTAVLHSSRAVPNDSFGWAVAIHENKIIVGAWDDWNGPTASGRAYIYRDDGTDKWSEIADLALEGTQASFFGCSVDISSDHAIVGCYGNCFFDIRENVGTAIIFGDHGDGWEPEYSCTRPLGHGSPVPAVSIDGKRAAVGFYGNAAEDAAHGPIGSVVILESDKEYSWHETTISPPSSLTGECRFGQSVALDGERIVIGAGCADYWYWPTIFSGWTRGNRIGAASVFERQPSGAWSEVTTIRPPAIRHGTCFGFSVGIDGNSLIIGTSNLRESDVIYGPEVESREAFIYER